MFITYTFSTIAANLKYEVLGIFTAALLEHAPKTSLMVLVNPCFDRLSIFGITCPNTRDYKNIFLLVFI